MEGIIKKTKRAIQKLLQTRPFKSRLYKDLYKWNVKRLIPALLDKPRRIIVENTNLCNLDCNFCPNQRMKREKGIMNMTLFKNIIAECKKENIEHVYIFGIGEPLLDPQYYEKVRWARDEGIKDIHCVTNGILLRRLPWVDYLGISVDATLGTKYEPVVLENMERIWEERKWRDVFIEARFKEYGNYEKYRKVCNKIGVYINVTNWGTAIKSRVPEGIQFPCSDLWSSMYITWDGRVALCCKDYECQEPIGWLKNNSLMEIWNGYSLRWFREMHLRDKYMSICKGCASNTHLVNPWWRVEL